MIKFILSKEAKKGLDRAPEHIKRKYLYWLDLVETIGIYESRKYKGFHDEPLKGNRVGQRSVRLSKSYRLIYKLKMIKSELVILEINKHDY